MGEWREVRLGDLGEVNRGRSRHRPRNAPYLYGGPYPFIQTGDIKNSGGMITHHSQTYSEAGLAQSRMWPAKTMVITIAANIAETALLTYPACFPDSVVGFIADQSKCDVRFVEYMFRYLKRQIQHENVGTGSVQDNINLQTFERLRFLAPSLDEQHAIASILGALDDKIDLNRRMNETLEAMARAIFKDWFVDFGPVRAKAEGRQPPGLSPEIAALFPDALDDDDKPVGWDNVNLGDLVTLIKGRSYKSSELSESNTALVTLKSFHRGGGYRTDGLKEYTGTYKLEQVIKPRELVVALTDVTQAADVIGKPAIVKPDYRYSTLVASLDVGILRPTLNEISIPYLYCLLRTEEFQNHIYGHCTGTTVLHLGKEGIPSYSFRLPSPPLLLTVRSFTGPLLRKWRFLVSC